MLDFLLIGTRPGKRGRMEVYPSFQIKRTTDLMIRGGDFYAIWVEDANLWSTDEQDAVQLIDRELDRYVEKHRKEFDAELKVLHLRNAETGMIDSWHKYCQKQMPNTFHMLDEKLIFSNTKTTKKDYASKKLPYAMEPGKLDAYETLLGTLYSEEERRKLEWAIGAVISGDSKKIQKFVVLYGAAGTGKSTVLNIIQALFEGYTAVFDARALGSTSNAFALEAFRTNPLVAIQHDGDLSRIEDNTRLNSLVSHEILVVNEKFKSTYANRFKSFLFMGTNKPVKITDARSGLIRRLIDVSPSGEKLAVGVYNKAVRQVQFELGAIAAHCLEVYQQEPGHYDDYIPLNMLGASNDFFNYMLDAYPLFRREDGTTLKAAWERYKTWCDEAKVTHPASQRVFKEELKNYFRDYKERMNQDDGNRVRSYYSGFRTEKFEAAVTVISSEKTEIPWLYFEEGPSVLDTVCADCPAQYANAEGTPFSGWDNVTTRLRDLDSSKLHYIRPPETHVVVDFDIPDETGQKCLTKNLEAALKWPPTYGELSKSGRGIHLHYIYTGDASKLSAVFGDHIEVKTFTGKASLRRKYMKSNGAAIATISAGLPLKGEKLVKFEGVQSEKSLRNQIIRNLKKEIHPNTRPSVDFIYKILEDAYASGLSYDLSDLENDVIAFAAGSTHQSDYCLSLTKKMKFKSETPSDGVTDEEAPMVFFDVEVFPNLFLISWKYRGADKAVTSLFNPKPADIEDLLRYRLVGFNNRRYDNHICYAGLLGYTNQQIYELSQANIARKEGAMFGDAYNLSYADVYDFSSKKQSLKKFEIELGIHHQELGLPYDKPVPEELWPKVAEYCANDVVATEATFDARKSDFLARQILADVAGMTVNDTTNTLTTRIIFGKERNPKLIYTNLTTGEQE